MAESSRSYRTATAFRRALEDRLKATQVESRLPLDRLRKQAAAQRLLARIDLSAPPGAWALKGGLAMIVWVGEHARATKDADATWRADRDALHRTLDAVMQMRLEDHFTFEIGTAQDISAEGPEGGLRFPIVVRLAGREFERLHLDVNLVPGDPRPLTTHVLRNAFGFAGLPDVPVPMIRAEQQLAEKLHAYARRYGTAESGRARDLYDMLVLAAFVELPTAGDIALACRQTFDLRNTTWPPTLTPPPHTWEPAWSGSTGFAATHAAPWRTLDAAFIALQAFWGPLIAESAPADARWNSQDWSWR